jgi:hypothetical protein
MTRCASLSGHSKNCFKASKPARPAALAAMLLGLTAALMAPTSAAHAQLARTFVSAASGNDANNCDRPTPCRTFQAAHDKTLSAGEITVLDPGGYGAVLITKAISIINDGVGEAGVLVSGAHTGIFIVAGASDAVSLRGLTIKGIGFGGGNGIVFNGGKSLTVENCAIRNLDGDGFGFGIDFLGRGPASLAVSNTLIADNARSAIVILPDGASAFSAVLNRVEMYNNGDDALTVSGLFTNGGSVNVTVTDSVAAGTKGTGFAVLTGTAPTTLTVVRSVSANNVTGLSASNPAATLRIGQSTVTGNATSWSAKQGAVLRSYGDNNIDGNADGDPAPPTIAKR